MLRTEKDIITAVKKREDDLKQLYDRFEDDYDLWRLAPYQLGKKGEYDNITSNEPRTLADKVVDTLTKAYVQIRIPLQEEDEEERKSISNAERFIYGCMNLANSRLKSVVSPTIKGLLAFYSTNRGWYGLLTYIHKNDGGETIPDIKVWDILHTTWDVGAEGLLWACHTRLISSDQAKSEYDVTATGIFGRNRTNIKVFDFWDKERNAIIVDGKFTKKPTKHGLDHIPVFINPVGSTPYIQSTKYDDTIKDFGESVFAANRSLYEPRNKSLTNRMTIIGLGAHNPLALYSAGGKKTFERSPYYKGAVIQFDVDKGETAEALYKPEMPKDAQIMDAELGRMISMGGMSPINYGELNFQLPGYGINLLRHAAQSILFPRQTAIEEGLEWMARELLTQYSKGGFGKLRLHGRDGSNEYFDMELSPKDIKGDWFPEVRLQPELPEDTAGLYAMAKIAIESGVLSRMGARENILKIQDPELEDDRILRERARQLPSIMVRDMATALLDDGRPDLAQALMREFQSRVSMEEEKTSPKTKEKAVQPEYATGLPEEVLPPEEMGRVQSESPGNI